MVNGKQTTNVRQIRQNFGKSKKSRKVSKGRNNLLGDTLIT